MDHRIAHQAHLRQARGEVAHAGRDCGARARLVALIALVLLAAASIAQADTAAWPGQVQAARSDWTAHSPPDSGWVDVTLPDDWSRRWPGFDGVVWYRLTWNQPAGQSGLFIDYLNMAGVISVDGTEIAHDLSLTEPLSRMWNTPRYFLLSPALVHAGENVLLLRVSGLSAYEPGLGPVFIGNPDAVQSLYEHSLLIRQKLPLLFLAMGVTLGAFFLTLWTMRRKESAYGWYAGVQFGWVAFQGNLLLQSPSPYATTDAFKAALHTAFFLLCACNILFVLRYCERCWPRREAGLWLLTALLIFAAWAAPHASMRSFDDAAMLYGLLTATLANGLFLYLAWQPDGRIDQRILALAGLASLLASYRDVLVVIGVFGGDTYYATYVEQFDVIAVALVLAWNFTRSLRRIEGFNAELQRNVNDARAELAATLMRQHELELVHARLGERVSLAHDLHDGLGGMLIGNIAALEQAPETVSSRKMLDTLRELRDDLRLIIDTASAQHYGEHSFAELLAPLRHRMTRLLEAHGIEIDWRVDDIAGIYLTTTQSLDLLRILQEALTNTLKHSGADRIAVELLRDGTTLGMEVTDNGQGMADTNETATGTGMRSMQARARRLGATLSIGSQPGATVVRLRMPFPETATPAAAIKPA